MSGDGVANGPRPIGYNQTYDQEYYDANGQAGDRPALGWYVRLVRRYIGDGPYLDFGCGTGHLVRRLSAQGPASGFEVSEYSACTARGIAEGCEIYTTLADIPSEHFGGITAVHVLEHLTDDVASEVLTTWQRALRPGARVLVVMPDPSGRARDLAGGRWTGFQDATHINLKPHAEWRAVFQSAGFDVLREGSDGLWNVPYGRLPKVVDFRAAPAFAQFVAGRLVLRPGAGESSVFILGHRG